MGIPITIDSDDLQALLFATGAIKNIESAIKGWQTDPLVLQSKNDFKEAHDRIASEWRRVTREPHPDQLADATSGELLILKDLTKLGPWFQMNLMEERWNFLWKNLRLRGFVEAGIKEHFIRWGDTTLHITIDLPQMVGRLTPRAWEQLDRAKNRAKK